MRTCFMHGFPNKPVNKYYLYHGVTRACLIQPDPGKFVCYDTKEPGGVPWDPDLANWISPTGFINPGCPSGNWYNEPYGYDGNTGIFAIGSIYGEVPPGEGWGCFLWYTHTDMVCKEVKIWSNIVAWTDKIDIDVFYNDGWHHIYEGVFPYEEWFIKEMEEAQIISAFRFRYHGTCDDWIEWYFGLECLVGEVMFYGYML